MAPLFFGDGLGPDTAQPYLTIVEYSFDQKLKPVTIDDVAAAGAPDDIRLFRGAAAAGPAVAAVETDEDSPPRSVGGEYDDTENVSMSDVVSVASTAATTGRDDLVGPHVARQPTPICEKQFAPHAVGTGVEPAQLGAGAASAETAAADRAHQGAQRQ